uniref:Uncharacterized protein MANES_09G043100 n=2 Tax=Rhizophora mucronata TaxID=61149 RepID=A0A2P2MCP4_RHIMU
MTSEQSYFRTIANIDMKLDFVPPFLINFISRQLIGSGFRLYQKVVTSLSKYDEDYGKALEDPLYVRIREALYSTDAPDGTIHEALCSTDEPDEIMEKKKLTDEASLFVQQQHPIKVVQKTVDDVEWIVHGEDESGQSFSENLQILPQTAIGEIMEEKVEESRHLKDEMHGLRHEVHGKNMETNAVATERGTFNEIEEEEREDVSLENGRNGMGQPATSESVKDRFVSCQNVFISPEVEQALETLEKAISVVRKHGFTIRPLPSLTNEDTQYQGKITEKESSLQEASEVCSNEVSIEASRKGRIVETSSHEPRNSTSNHDIRRAGSNASTREVNYNRIVPALPEHYLSQPNERYNQVVVSSSGIAEVPIVDTSTKATKQISTEAFGDGKNVLRKRKNVGWRKKLNFCFFTPDSLQMRP